MPIEKSNRPCSAGIWNDDGLADCQFNPTFEALELYSKGLLQEDVRHALSQFVDREKAEQDSWKASWVRSYVIDELAKVVQGEVEKGDPGVLAGDLVPVLSSMPIPFEQVLQEMKVEDLHQILRTENPQQRLQKMYDFAQRSREGEGPALRKNLFFSRTLLRYVAEQGQLPESFSPELVIQAEQALSDSRGAGGSWSNLKDSTWKSILCLGGKICTPPDPLDWSDEAMETMVQDTYILEAQDLATRMFIHSSSAQSLQILFASDLYYRILGHPGIRSENWTWERGFMFYNSHPNF